MPSDVQLDGEAVRVLANDLRLEYAGRLTDDNPYRRAMTHDYRDGITLNWDRDYPGGITLLGPVSVPDTLSFGRGSTGGLVIEVSAPLPLPTAEFTHLVTDGVEVGVQGFRPGGSSRAAAPPPADRTRIDLEQELRLLWEELRLVRTQISQLHRTR